jgi:hypothetical protein
MSLPVWTEGSRLQTQGEKDHELQINFGEIPPQEEYSCGGFGSDGSRHFGTRRG